MHVQKRLWTRAQGSSAHLHLSLGLHPDARYAMRSAFVSGRVASTTAPAAPIGRLVHTAALQRCLFSGGCDRGLLGSAGGRARWLDIAGSACASEAHHDPPALPLSVLTVMTARHGEQGKPTRQRNLCAYAWNPEAKADQFRRAANPAPGPSVLPLAKSRVRLA